MRASFDDGDLEVGPSQKEQRYYKRSADRLYSTIAGEKIDHDARNRRWHSYVLADSDVNHVVSTQRVFQTEVLAFFAIQMYRMASNPISGAFHKLFS